MHRHPPGQWQQRHSWLLDSIIAVVLTAMTVGALWGDRSDGGNQHANAFTTILAIAATAPLVWRRRNPIPVVAIVVTGQFVLEFVGVSGPGGLSIMIAVFSFATYTNGIHRAVAAKVLAMLGLGALTVGFIDGRIDLGRLISAVLFLVGAFVLGDNVQRRRLHHQAQADQVEREERERELMSRQRVQDERSRIARELHDVVAHSVSLMIIQAGAARRSMASAPQQAEAALKDVESTGRQAMDELRRVLGVLRAGDESHELAPQPSLASVRALIDNDPTLPVQLSEVGTPPEDVPTAIGLSLYRVVQEALTNIRKHGGQVRHVAVHVAYEAERVMVQITDDGRGASVAINADGHGIVGMRERMALCGGTLSAGPRVGGGWQVRASAPLVQALA
ncbi:MAG TPA: histidine kinase [Ilumatobacteraceae bacterium]